MVENSVDIFINYVYSNYKTKKIFSWSYLVLSGDAKYTNSDFLFNYENNKLFKIYALTNVLQFVFNVYNTAPVSINVYTNDNELNENIIKEYIKTMANDNIIIQDFLRLTFEHGTHLTSLNFNIITKKHKSIFETLNNKLKKDLVSVYKFIKNG